MTKDSSEEKKVWRLGILGAGTVGKAFAKAVAAQAETFKRAGLGRCEITRILVRDLSKERNLPVDAGVYTTNADEIVGHAEIDIVVSLIGGTSPASGYMRRALRAGQHVITANKAIIAGQGAELEAIAAENGVALLYEAAVGGGLPIIRPLKTHFIPNGVRGIEAILNGTCNFILSEMNAGQSFDAALENAQEQGLAEADPTMDIEGIDAAQKLAILATMAFGRRFDERAVARRGIVQLDAVDLEFARANGLALILLASASPHRAEGAALSVMPTFVAAKGPLARAEGPNNIFSLSTETGGQFESMALGAGAATAASVMADLASLLGGAWRGEMPTALAGAAEYEPPTTLPYDGHPHGWYIRAANPAEAEAALKKLGAKTGVPAEGIIEAADLTYADLRTALGDAADTTTVVQYHRSERPVSFR